ncbi:MAG TPA: long-chain fatty acid--CoA ligase [Actinomycetota bacterium]|nr:long-chain fatty acid--CoA ligase [Actinomycetota bacterium]
MNVAELLDRSAAQAPDKPALLTSAGGTVTFAELAGHAGRAAAGLAAAGIGPGDRVAIAMHNVPEFVYAYFGALRAGAVVVPLNPTLTVPEVGRVLADSGATLVTGVPPAAEAARAAAEEAGIRYVDGREWPATEDPPPTRPAADDDLAVLAYTSGTTGDPKGAMLTHGNLLANLEQQMSIPDARVEPSDVLLLSLPLFHIFGLNVTLGLLARTGATGVLTERFEPVECLRLIQQHRVSVMFGAPTMYTALANTPGADQYDLSSVRLAISGAAPLQPEVLSRFKELFGVDVYEGYGLTETAPTLTSNRMAEAPRAGSIGKPLPGVEIRLVDEAGDDVELGDPGEILARGPNVFQGYWNKPDETRRAFDGEWFRTGDVAVQDEDGYLYIVDRKRDMVIVSGFNVFPSEVEQALTENPKVAEAAVVGVPHAYTGEAVKAFVVLEPGASATPDEVIADVQSRLARFKCPREVEIVDTLPHLLTGKVLRRALRT